jgi:glycine/D-amino acid oxidase-like deaminating enzyme
MWPFRRPPAHAVRSARPWWLLRDGTGDAAPALRQSLECDVAIVGAGITGAFIADALVHTGRRIVMLDGDEPGHASTAASTALLQYEIDTHLSDLTRLIGAERATLAYRACVASFEKLERRFPELLEPCDYQRQQSLYLAANEAAVPDLRLEYSARRAIGISVSWLEKEELRQRYGVHRPAGIVSVPAASFDPLRFTRAVLAGCLRHGVACYSRSRVMTVEEAQDHVILHVDGGHTVRARHVVVAAGYQSLEFLPAEAAGLVDLVNTFALITEPAAELTRRPLPLIWESARPYLYLRGTRDGRLLLGGMDVPFRSAAAREAALARQTGRLAVAYQELFGEELPPVAYTWAGSFAATRDGLPYIGSVPGHSSRLLFALCLGGNGTTYAIHAGDLIRAHLEGASHELDPVFGFQRRQDLSHGGSGSALRLS